MMSVLMGVRDAKTLARAADLGTAMQLTNIARDVGEDAQLGRIYSHGRAEGRGRGHRRDARKSDLLRGCWRGNTATSRAGGLALQTRRHGIAQLPRKYQPGIRAARKLYAAIGQKVVEHGFNSVDQRAIVTPRKIRSADLGYRFRTAQSKALDTPALPQNQFLIDAVVASGGAAPAIKSDPLR